MGRSKGKTKGRKRQKMSDSLTSEEDLAHDLEMDQSLEKVEEEEEQVIMNKEDLQDYLENLLEAGLKSKKSDMKAMMKESLSEVLQEEGLVNMTSFRQEVAHELDDIKRSIEFSNTSSEETRDQVEAIKKENEELKEEVQKLKIELDEQKRHVERIDFEVRAKNLKITGLEETEDQDDKNNLAQKLKTDMQVELDMSCTVTRLGRKTKDNKYPRPLLVKFQTESSKKKIWENRKKLNKSSISIKEDLPFEVEKRSKQLLPIMHRARKQNLKASVYRDTLFINNEKYTVDTLNRIPESLKQDETPNMQQDDDTVFFWGGKSVLSNFHICDPPFKEGTVSFNCVEQFYAYHKAKLFNDEQTMKKILTFKDPKDQKRARVQGFMKKVWEENAEQIMKEGLTLKFTQVPGLRKVLLSTGEKELVEASPRDKIWCIGLSLGSPNLRDRTKWGQNKLGHLLMDVRKEIT